MLSQGDIVRGKLIEAIDENQWIVSFQGKLLQVKNHSQLSFQEGRLLNLKIERLDPLSLRVLDSSGRSVKRHLNRTI